FFGFRFLDLNKRGPSERAFFFQAEDGIRDFHVTGVQTCALPIYFTEHSYSTLASQENISVEQAKQGIDTVIPSLFLGLQKKSGRSEERRVGKECRSRWERCP